MINGKSPQMADSTQLLFLYDAITYDDAISLKSNLDSSSVRTTICAGETEEITLLMHAAHQGSVECMQVLINAGCNVNATDSDGDTAMHHAAESSCPDAIDVLMKYGARINAQNKKGMTPLMVAACMQDYIMVSRIINRGGLIDILDFNERSALYYAAVSARLPNIEVVRQLLLSGANPRELYENSCVLTVSGSNCFGPPFLLVPLRQIRHVLYNADLGIVRCNPNQLHPGSKLYNDLF